MRLTDRERTALGSIRERGRADDIHGNTIKALLAKGLIEHGGGDVRITPAGVDALPAERRRRRRPPRFHDSFTFVDAVFSADVVRAPLGKLECARVSIDCNGTVYADAGELDVLIEILEKARENLRARRRA